MMPRRIVGVVIIVLLGLAFLTLGSEKGCSENENDMNDIVVEGNEVREIADAEYTHTGNILVRENGTLIIRSAVVLIDQAEDKEFSILVENNSTLILDKGVVRSDHFFTLTLRDNARLEMKNSSELYLWAIIAEDDATLKISGSKVHGTLNLNCSSIEITDSEIDVREIFKDTFEEENDYWEFEKDWGRSNNKFYKGEWSLSDTPVGSYSISYNHSAIIKEPFDFSDISGAQLKFYHALLLADDGDTCYVEASTDEEHWIELASYTGSTLTGEGKLKWREEKIDLSGFAGEEGVKIRFRLKNVGGETDDGWYIDNVRVDLSLKLMSSSISISKTKLTTVSKMKLQSPSIVITGSNLTTGSELSIDSQSLKVENSKMKSDSCYINSDTIELAGEINATKDMNLTADEIILKDLTLGAGSLGMEAKYINATNLKSDTGLMFDDEEVANLTSCYAPSISIKDDAIVYKYWWLTVSVVDSINEPIPNALIEVLDFFEDTVYHSEKSNENGVSVLRLLGSVNTTEKDEFKGNYRVRLSYDDESVTKKVSMRDNVALEMKLELIINPMPPFINITYPENNSTVKGKITINGTAKDDSGYIERVEIRIDNGSWLLVGGMSGILEWTFEWDTTNVSNGWHNITVRAFDGALYSNASITVFVDNKEEELSVWEFEPILFIIVAIIVIAVLSIVIYVFRVR